MTKSQFTETEIELEEVTNLFIKKLQGATDKNDLISQRTCQRVVETYRNYLFTTFQKTIKNKITLRIDEQIARTDDSIYLKHLAKFRAICTHEPDENEIRSLTKDLDQLIKLCENLGRLQSGNLTLIEI